MKRHSSACDADYDVSPPDPRAQQTKRQKLLELDGLQVCFLLTACRSGLKILDFQLFLLKKLNTVGFGGFWG